MSEASETKIPTECPDCGEVSDPQAYAWHMEKAPHPDPKACIRHLRSLLDRAVRALENHNLL